MPRRVGPDMPAAGGVPAIERDGARAERQVRVRPPERRLLTAVRVQGRPVRVERPAGVRAVGLSPERGAVEACQGARVGAVRDRAPEPSDQAVASFRARLHRESAWRVVSGMR